MTRRKNLILLLGLFLIVMLIAVSGCHTDPLDLPAPDPSPVPPLP